MACFIVPLVEAVAVSIYRKSKAAAISRPDANALRKSVPALEKMLWGGSVMLIIDHIINGELSWRFPFFTALGVEGGGEVFLREILTVGVPMALAVTLVWVIYALLKERNYSLSTNQ